MKCTYVGIGACLISGYARLKRLNDAFLSWNMCGVFPIYGG